LKRIGSKATLKLYQYTGYVPHVIPVKTGIVRP
jgi:hypothetical protein